MPNMTLDGKVLENTLLNQGVEWFCQGSRMLFEWQNALDDVSLLCGRYAAVVSLVTFEQN